MDKNTPYSVEKGDPLRAALGPMRDPFGVYSAVRDGGGRIVDFRVEYVNAAACDANRLSEEEQVGRLLCEILPAHRGSGLFDRYCGVVETGRPVEETSLVYSDVYGGGARLTRAFDIRAWKMGDGFAATWRDVTADRQAAEERAQLLRGLQAERQRLDAVLRQMPSGVTIAEFPSGRLLYYNARAEEILGHPLLPAEDVAGYAQYGGVHPDGRPYRPDEYPTARALLRGEVVRGEEIRYVRGDGRLAHLSAYATRVHDAAGAPTAVVCTFYDVTAQHETEERFRRAEEALRDSELRYRTLAEAVPQLLWVRRPDGSISFNDQWPRYTGRGMADLEAGGMGWLESVHPDDRERTFAVRTAASAAGEPYENELRLRRRDGAYRWHVARAVPLRDAAGGAVLAWYGAATDIDDHKRAEMELAAAEAKQRRIAETLQRTLLRPPAPDAFPGLEIATRYEAAWDEAQVGGDFFDAFALPDGRVALVVGDVSGKGLAAAEKTASVKYALRAFASELTSPAAVLGRLNRFLCDAPGVGEEEDGGAFAFVTLCLVYLDAASGRVTLSLAGAESPLVAGPAGDAVALELAGLPLCVDTRFAYGEREAELGPGGLLLMTSDGVTEARDARGQFLGADGLARLLRAAPGAPLDAAAETILEGARGFSGGSLRDDVCLLLCRRR